MEKQFILRNNPENFKYWKYNGADGLICTIEGMSIRCNQAENLNDEYDCAPPFICTEGFSDKAIHVNKRGNSFQGMVNAITQSDSVTSFTLSGYDNILMWGHYTNKFSGGVIEFKNTNPIIQYGTAIVHYQNEPIKVSADFCEFWNDERKTLPDINIVFEDIMKMYTTKSEAWEYEKEIRYWTGVPKNADSFDTMVSDNKEMATLRVIKGNDGIRYVHIPISANDISAIYVGHRMTGIDRLRLYSAIKKNNIDVPVKVLKPKQDEYKLEFVEGEFELRYILQKVLNDFEKSNDMCLEKLYEQAHNIDEKELNKEFLQSIFLLQNRRTEFMQEIRKKFVSKLR